MYFLQIHSGKIKRFASEGLFTLVINIDASWYIWFHYDSIMIISLSNFRLFRQSCWRWFTYTDIKVSHTNSRQSNKAEVILGDPRVKCEPYVHFIQTWRFESLCFKSPLLFPALTILATSCLSLLPRVIQFWWKGVVLIY